MKKIILIALVLTLIFIVLISGCESERGEDTRQYIDTMGIVFTNDAYEVINELYVFPIAIDGTSIFEQDMGPDLIKNTSRIKRIGSFGVTLELQNTSFNVMARDRNQGIYVFGNIPLSNACEMVLSFDHGTISHPVLAIFHRNGEVHAIEGEFVAPGDAPDHAHSPLRRTATIHLTVRNLTDYDLSEISIHEADHPSRGAVELLRGNLAAKSSTSINYRVFEEDTEVTEWLLYVRTEDGVSTLFEEPFNPWEMNVIEIAMDGDTKTYTAS